MSYALAMCMENKMKQIREAELGNQLTDQGKQLITIQYRDKLNGIYLNTKQVSRATLAKLYHDRLITHAINGMPVVDV